MGFKLNLPIFKKNLGGYINILCQKCGSNYMTTFKKYNKDKSCPVCKFKLVDNI